MRASMIEFRLRYLLHGLIFGLGFGVPWDRLFVAADGAIASQTSTWLTLASLWARSGWLSFSDSTIVLLVVGIVFASLGAWLRTWGSAYLGASIVKDGAMHGRAVVADGPYRYMRNPLYLGTMLHAVALALLMEPVGAIFTILAIGFLQVRLMLGEEHFLSGALGQAYAAYGAMVPRIMPSLRPRTAVGPGRARWGQAVLGETYMIGVALCFAVFGWRYNAFLLTKCVLICLGVSLVARALLPSASAQVRETRAVETGS